MLVKLVYFTGFAKLYQHPQFLCTYSLCLYFGWGKEIGQKAAHKMLFKLTADRTRNEKIKMHKAEYKELWQYIEDLSAVKRIDNGDEVKSPEIIEEGEDDGSTSIADFRDRKKNSNNVATRTETNGESVATQESGNTRREKPPIVRARSSKILFFK